MTIYVIDGPELSRLLESIKQRETSDDMDRRITELRIEPRMGGVAVKFNGGEWSAKIGRIDEVPRAATLTPDQARKLAGYTRTVLPDDTAPEYEYTEAQMVAIGGKLWTRGGKRRVYLNWHGLVGLAIEVDGITDAIRTASINGEPLPSRRAGVLRAAKVWWEDGRLHYENVAAHSRHFYGDNRLVVALLAGIAQAAQDTGRKR